MEYILVEYWKSTPHLCIDGIVREVPMRFEEMTITSEPKIL